MTTELEVDAFLAGWEIECCVPAPGEDDRVSWPLLWVDDASGPGATDIPWVVQAVFPGVGADPGGVLLAHGPLHAWWIGLSPDGVPGRGCLITDQHGGVPDAALPLTPTNVVGVRVVEQAYRQVMPQGYEVIPGGYALRPMSRSPRWFDGGPPEDGPWPDVLRRESGVLVGLRADGPPGMLPG